MANVNRDLNISGNETSVIALSRRVKVVLHSSQDTV